MNTWNPDRTKPVATEPVACFSHKTGSKYIKIKGKGERGEESLAALYQRLYVQPSPLFTELFREPEVSVVKRGHKWVCLR